MKQEVKKKVLEFFFKSIPSERLNELGISRMEMLENLDTIAEAIFPEEKEPLWQVIEYRRKSDKSIEPGYPKEVLTVAHEGVAVQFAKCLNENLCMTADVRRFFDVVPVWPPEEGDEGGGEDLENPLAGKAVISGGVREAPPLQGETGGEAQFSFRNPLDDYFRVEGVTITGQAASLLYLESLCAQGLHISKGQLPHGAHEPLFLAEPYRMSPGETVVLTVRNLSKERQSVIGALHGTISKEAPGVKPS